MIEIDSLFDCRSKYEGPASRAVQLGFNLTPSLVAYETREGGMILLRIPPTICGQDSATWAGYEKSPKFPEAWTPIIDWYDSRDLDQVTKGETYWSETALKNPNGRLKIVERFSLTIPETTDESLKEHEAQLLKHGLWRHDPPILQVDGPRARSLPWYIRIPRSEWSQPPAYLRAPDRPPDPEGLRDFLDALPMDEGLMFLGEFYVDGTFSEAVSFSIGGLLTGRSGSADDLYYHGIPQKNEFRWGMYVNERSWNEAQIKRERLPYYDDWIPLDLEEGVYVLRPDTPGMKYRNNRKPEDFGLQERKLNLLGKSFVNGPYNWKKANLIFDLQTRDLWVRR
ncbi:hypothetical protein [Roseovarius albus]|uniref:hypothetical protein n=1 Tax=Roseovarius albus TaxID=1247867 RepID=UPI00117A1097|nr:hypothetical protein [Roseovarius albus]